MNDVKVPVTLWELDPPHPVMNNARWRTPPAKLLELREFTVEGCYDQPEFEDSPVTVHFPDGTEFKTTLFTLIRHHGLVIDDVRLEGSTPGECPSHVVTIAVTNDPPADEPHVVEGPK